MSDYAIRPSPISRSNLKEEVASALRERIFSGAIPIGTHIDQDLLATEWGISKLPIREALIILEGEGIIRTAPRRGAFVAELTPTDVRDHFMLYGVVSRLAAERAAAALTDQGLAELEDVLDRLDQTEDTALQERLNTEFHAGVNRCCGSRKLRFITRQLAGSVSVRFYEAHPTWRDTSQLQHRAILAALTRRDGTRAGLLMQEHLASAGDQAVEALAASGFFGDTT